MFKEVTIMQAEVKEIAKKSRFREEQNAFERMVVER